MNIELILPEKSIPFVKQLKHKYHGMECLLGIELKGQQKGWSFKFRTVKGITQTHYNITKYAIPYSNTL